MSRALRAAAAVVGAAAFLGTASPLAAASYWVSGVGSDVNDCSEKRPCREMQRALALAFAGDTVWVRAGSYAPFDVTRQGPIAIRALDPAHTFVAPRRDESSSIYILDTAHITIDGLQVLDARLMAIAVRNSRSILIRNGIYRRAEAACIQVFRSDLVTIENNECSSGATGTGVLIQNSNGVTVRGNRIYDNARPGILSAADEVARGLLVEGNRIHGNLRGVQLRGSHHGATLRNNLVYDNLGAGILLDGTRSDFERVPVVIEHNTVVQPAATSHAVDLANTGSVRLRNNVLLQPHAGMGVGLIYRDDVDVRRTNSDHNVLTTVATSGGVVSSLADWQALGHELHSVAAVPSDLFVDAEAEDFRLRPGAPALDRGQETDVGIDFLGEPRPGGAGWDLGAYERPGVVDPAPAGFRRSPLAEPLAQPTTLALAADGRIFVGEQTGALRVIRHGRLLPVPFAVLPVSSEGERGLLGVALDPAFPAQPYVYVYYTTAAAPVHNRVARLTADGDVAMPGSERVLLDMPALDSLRHPGGAMDFGADGKLYVAVGDDDLDVPPAGETDDADDADPQQPVQPFGKVLRLNPDPANPIPADNPFANTTGAYRALWALGLRNPRGLAARPGTPQIFVNDAGATWQEIDEVAVRANYGWPRVEGPSNGGTYRAPRYTYRAEGGAAGGAIAGATFYNPTHVVLPSDFIGDYVFADRGAGWIRSYDPQSRQVRQILGGFASPIDVKAGADGALYVLSQGDGRVYRVSYPSPVRLLASPMDQAAREGEPVTFAVRVTGSDPFTYQWQRNGADVPGAHGPAYTLPPVDLADSGARFRCVVMNPLSIVTSSDAQLTVAPAPALRRLAIGDATALEPQLGGSGAAVFIVSLSRASTEPVSVSVETRSGTAIAGEDFEPISRRLVFAPGTTSLQVIVPVRVDLLPEPPERFSALLTNPTGATIGDGTGVGTILEGETE
jgi:parallel beta-helix repeat protein